MSTRKTNTTQAGNEKRAMNFGNDNTTQGVDTQGSLRRADPSAEAAIGSVKISIAEAAKVLERINRQ